MRLDHRSKRLLLLTLALAMLLLAACGAKQETPPAPAEEPAAPIEQAPEAPAAETPVTAEAETVQEPAPTETPKKELPPPPDIDINSWEYTFCNSYNSRGWITCQRGNLEGIGIDARIVDAATNLMADARAEGYTIFMAYAYLNTDWLQNMYLRQYWICDYDRIATARSLLGPGVNEHQTGLAIDFTDDYAHAATYETFEDPEIFDSELFAWLMEHCADYGFIFRYPAEKAVWYGNACPHAHFRYVGVEAAKFIKEHDLCLEEFLSLYDPDRVYVPDEGRFA